MKSASEWQKFSTLRLTAHLWRRTDVSRSGSWWESKCRRLNRSSDELQISTESDRICGHCFPAQSVNADPA